MTITIIDSTEQAIAARAAADAAQAAFNESFPAAVAEYVRSVVPDALAITVRHRECGDSWYVPHVETPDGKVSMAKEQNAVVERAVKATGATHTGNVPGATYVSWTECRIEFED